MTLKKLITIKSEAIGKDLPNPIGLIVAPWDVVKSREALNCVTKE